MTNTQTRAERMQEIVETQNILKNSDHEQIKNMSSDLTKTVKTWQDAGIGHSNINAGGFAFKIMLIFAKVTSNG